MVAPRSGMYGKKEDPIIIGDIKCTGDELDISACKSAVWLSTNSCYHDEDVAVQCGE